MSTLYRTHRPEQFCDVIGQEIAVAMLEKHALHKSSLAHAYLFVGTRGIGKTTLARIFAKEIGIFPEDIREIDGASYRKLEEAKEITDSVYTLPLRSPYKVYIIDEVHMFTTEAFNALLKTLEEPPKHVLFFLATTELHKVPKTIQSRCQILSLKTPTENNLIQNLKRVCEKEKIMFEEKALLLIAIHATGSFRDSLTILQQVLGNLEKECELSEKDVLLSLGIPLFEHTIAYLESFLENNIQDLLQKHTEFQTKSIIPKRMVLEIISILRIILWARYDETLFLSALQNNLDKKERFVTLSKNQKINAQLLLFFLDLPERVEKSVDPWLSLIANIIAYYETK
jgi:DNA polymerase III subunit gamma/tau